MKVLHILYSGLGGHANIFFSMAKEGKRASFIQEAVFAGVEDLLEDYKIKCRSNDIEYTFIKKKQGLDLKFYRKLIKKIRTSDAEIIFLHASAHIMAAKAAIATSPGRKKIIVRETQANELKTKREWLMLRYAFKFADNVVFLSEAYNEQVKRRLHRVYDLSKVRVIPNGIDLETFRPVEGRKSGSILLGMQSRIVRIKDHITLLEAFARIRRDQTSGDCRLIIAGDGEFMEALKKTAAALQLSDVVEFTGTLEETALVKFIQSIDIYVHASLGETMSTAIMQAMACKKPVVASDVPGINNMLINNETGLLVAPKDADSMYGSIMNLIHNNVLKQKLAENAYQYAIKNFSSERMFNEYKKIFCS
jgi:glycosyltransferase involved in cell wall biosynthesis